MSERGIVKWYSLARGYGFIHREDAGEDEEDIFVHHTEVPDDLLQEGEQVRFELVESSKGLKARNVRRLSSDSLSS